MTPSGRRSTAISRASHSILRKAGFVKTAAAFPLILRLPKYRSFADLFLPPDIDRLSLLQKGPDASLSSSRRTPGPIRRVVSSWHGRRDLLQTRTAAEYGSRIALAFARLSGTTG